MMASSEPRLSVPTRRILLLLLSILILSMTSERTLAFVFNGGRLDYGRLLRKYRFSRKTERMLAAGNSLPPNRAHDDSSDAVRKRPQRSTQNKARRGVIKPQESTNASAVQLSARSYSSIDDVVNTLMSLAVSSRSPIATAVEASTGKNDDDDFHRTSTRSEDISLPRTSISKELLVAIDFYANRMSIAEVADTLWSLGTLRVKPQSQFRVVSSDVRHASSELESKKPAGTSELIEKLLDRFSDTSYRLSDGAVALMMKEERSMSQPAGAGTLVNSRNGMGSSTMGIGSSAVSAPEEGTTRESSSSSSSSSSSTSIVDDILQGDIGKTFAHDASAEALSMSPDYGTSISTRQSDAKLVAKCLMGLARMRCEGLNRLLTNTSRETMIVRSDSGREGREGEGQLLQIMSREENLVLCLGFVADSLDARGLANVIWSAGQLQLPLFATATDPSGSIHRDSGDSAAAETGRQGNGWNDFMALEYSWTRKRLLAQIAAVASSINSKDQSLSSILWGLYKMGANWESLPPEVQQSLSSMLCRHCVKMSPQALGNSIFALGKMGARMSAFPDRVTVALEVAVRRAAPKMVRRDAMQTLQGLALSRFEWKLLSDKTREVLGLALFGQAQNWSGGGPLFAVEIATVLSSLSKLGAKWSDFDAPVRAAITVGIVSVTDSDRLENLSKTKDQTKRDKVKQLYGAVSSRGQAAGDLQSISAVGDSMGEKAAGYPKTTSALTSPSADDRNLYRNKGHTNTVINQPSLSQLQSSISSDTYKGKSFEDVISGAEDLSNLMDEARLRGTSNGADIDLDVRTASNESEDAIDDEDNVSSIDTDSGVSVSDSRLRDFSVNDITEDEINQAVQTSLGLTGDFSVLGVAEVRKTLARAVASMVQSLGDLRVDFNELPQEAKISILRGLASFVADLSGQGFSMALLGLANMGVQWNQNIPKPLGDVFLKRFGEMLRGTTMSSIKNEVSDGSVDLSLQALTNCIYSFGTMGIQWGEKRMTPTMKNHIALLVSMALSDLQRRGKSVNEVSPLASGSDVANLLQAMVRLGVTMESSSDYHDDIIRAAPPSPPAAASRDHHNPYSNPGTPYPNRYPVRISRVVLELAVRFIDTAGDMRSRDFAVSLRCLGLLGVDIHTFVRCLPVMPTLQKAPGDGSGTSSYATDNHHNDTLDKRRSRQLEAFVRDKAATLTDQGVMMCLQGLSYMTRDSCNDLRSTTDEPSNIAAAVVGGAARLLLSSLWNQRAVASAQSVAISTYSLGKMKIKWEQLLQEDIYGLSSGDAICELIALKAPLMTGQNIANIFVALKHMEARWDQLTEDALDSLLRTLAGGPHRHEHANIAHTLSPQGIVSILVGLQSLGLLRKDSRGQCRSRYVDAALVRVVDRVAQLSVGSGSGDLHFSSREAGVVLKVLTDSSLVQWLPEASKTSLWDIVSVGSKAAKAFVSVVPVPTSGGSATTVTVIAAGDDTNTENDSPVSRKDEQALPLLSGRDAVSVVALLRQLVLSGASWDQLSELSKRKLEAAIRRKCNDIAALVDNGRIDRQQQLRLSYVNSGDRDSRGYVPAGHPHPIHAYYSQAATSNMVNRRRHQQSQSGSQIAQSGQPGDGQESMLPSNVLYNLRQIDRLLIELSGLQTVWKDLSVSTQQALISVCTAVLGAASIDKDLIRKGTLHRETKILQSLAVLGCTWDLVADSSGLSAANRFFEAICQATCCEWYGDKKDFLAALAIGDEHEKYVSITALLSARRKQLLGAYSLALEFHSFVCSFGINSGMWWDLVEAETNRAFLRAITHALVPVALFGAQELNVLETVDDTTANAPKKKVPLTGTVPSVHDFLSALRMTGASWTSLPTRPRNELSTALAAALEVYLLNRNNFKLGEVKQVIDELSSMKADPQMLTKELRKFFALPLH